MYNADLPRRADLPTSAQLLRSTIMAVISAAVILVTVVLPSEYGIDPTGVGRVLGLTEMGKIKVQLAREAAEDANATAISASGTAPPPASATVADQTPPPPPEPVGTLLAQTAPATVPPAQPGPAVEPSSTADRFAWTELTSQDPEASVLQAPARAPPAEASEPSVHEAPAPASGDPPSADPPAAASP